MATRFINALVALSFATVSLGQQKVPPSDADFHAAYCIPLLDEEISFLQRGLAKVHAYTKNAQQADSPEFWRLGQQHLERWRAGIVRLEKTRQTLSAYFAPRMRLLDLRALSDANLAAQTDWREFVMMNSGSCPDEWPFNPAGQLKVQMTFCTDLSLIARVQSCRRPTWLPRSL